MDSFTNSNNSVRMCFKHRNPIHYINIFDKTNKPFTCIRCAREKSIKLEGLLHFSELLDEDNFDCLMNFPPLEEQVVHKLSQVSTLSNKNEGILKSIEDYFNNLTSGIEKQILQAKNSANGKAIRILKSNEEIFNKYNYISSREQLRQIIKHGGEDMESRVSEILSKLIKEENIKQNSTTLEACLDDNKIWRERVSFDIPTNVQNSILSMFTHIDFFPGLNLPQFEEPVNENQQQLLSQGKNIENSNCKILKDLIGSKFNFCTEEFLSETKKMIDGISFYINSYNLPENPYQVERSRLNQAQTNQLIELLQKITTISEAYATQNIPEEELSKTIQPKTCNYLKHQKLFSSKDEQVLKQLLKKFPIIELTPLHSFVGDSSILDSVNLIKSGFNSSQGLAILKQLNNGHLVMSNPNASHRQSFCDFILNKSRSYIFRISVSQNTNNNCNLLVFGLQPDTSKDSNCLSSNNMSYCEHDGYNYGMQKRVRGGQLHQGNGQPVNREFEMRICLEKKIIRVSDLPNYSSVCEIDDPNKIKSNIDYRFGLFSCNQSTMAITEIIETYSFDDKM